METIQKNIDIDAPVDEVFAYAVDPTTSPEWLPSLVEVRNVTGTGVGQHWEWTYKMIGVPLRGESTVIAHVSNERRVTRTKGGVEGLWTLVLEPRQGGTHLELTVEYVIPVPVLGKLAEKLVVRRNDRELELAVQNIKDHCEG